MDRSKPGLVVESTACILEKIRTFFLAYPSATSLNQQVMHKTLLSLLAFVVGIGALAQNDNKIVIGKTDSLFSNILKEQRKVWVYTPDLTSGDKTPGRRYPVLYLLDGDAHFASVVGLVQQLSQVNGNSIYPEMMVVAIPNTDRTRDLTPTHVDSDPPAMDSAFSRTSGGGENFIAFLQHELIPHMDSLYPTAPYRVLVGHSFGGLAVMNVLTNHPKLFDAYVAIDPSMWYDHQRFLVATKKKLAANNFEGRRLYLGIANTLPGGMTLAKLKKDSSDETRHIRSILELDRFLKTTRNNGLVYASRYYQDDDHSSVPLVSEYDGLRFIFDYYRLRLDARDFLDSTTATVSKFQKHYQKVSKVLGYPVAPPESMVNYLGYDALQKKHFARAAGFFQLNMANYPSSSNVYDSYGDLLAEQKDTVGAIRQFQQALALQDVPGTRLKLLALQNRSGFQMTGDELQKFAGVFEIESVQVSVNLQVREGVLWAIVPGEENSELVPLSANSFTVKNKSGYLVQFNREGNEVTGFVSTQPNGTFKAHRKK